MGTNRDIEDVKYYWDSRPCNIRHSDKEIGTKEYYEVEEEDLEEGLQDCGRAL